VARSVLLRARGSCESRVSDPSHAAQGNLAKGAVDEACDITSGLVLPVAAPEAAQSDTDCLMLRESHPCAPTTRPIAGGIDLSKLSTEPGAAPTLPLGDT